MDAWRAGQLKDAPLRHLMAEATRIPLSEPSVGEREASYLRQCIDENWVAARGRFVGEFEQRFAAIHGYAEAASTSSGTAALHLAMVALGLGPGDEVLVPALTFVASANAVSYVGATPVFVDVDPETLTIDPADAALRCSDRTRAILVVHLYGHPADMDAIEALAAEKGVAIIEDATEALGARHRGRLCGTLGDIGCFSFNGNKVITAGGGGMILAREPWLLERMRHLGAQARLAAGYEYRHDEVGFNYSLSNLQAAVGLAQLERLDQLVAAKRALAARYAEALADVPGLRFCAEAPWAQSNRWLSSVLVDEEVYGRSSRAVIDALARGGIEARPFFTPLPALPPYSAHDARIPVAERLFAQGVCLPSSAHLDAEQQQRVIAGLIVQS